MKKVNDFNMVPGSTWFPFRGEDGGTIRPSPRERKGARRDKLSIENHYQQFWHGKNLCHTPVPGLEAVEIATSPCRGS
jgi:hypothetical protein